MSSERYKLRVKVGDAEFFAIGPDAVVKDQFDAFLGCLAESPAFKRSPVSTFSPTPSVRRVVEPKGDDDEARQQAGTRSGKELARLFSVDPKRKVVSLKSLPSTNGSRDIDTILLLIVGFREAFGAEQVRSPDLIAAARQSGLSVERIDRITGGHPNLITKGGQRKWTRYGVTNPGLQRAEQLMGEMFESLPA